MVYPLNIYRLYKNNELVAEGTMKELAESVGLKETTLRSHYTNPNRSKTIRIESIGKRESDVDIDYLKSLKDSHKLSYRAIGEEIGLSNQAVVERFRGRATFLPHELKQLETLFSLTEGTLVKAGPSNKPDKGANHMTENTLTTPTMTNLIELIKQWSIDRSLDNADSHRQFVKLIEEVGEIADALNSNDRRELIDGIGDTLVVLIILAQQQGLELEDCLFFAYNEIKDRTGKTVDGVFVKNSDL